MSLKAYGLLVPLSHSSNKFVMGLSRKSPVLLLIIQPWQNLCTPITMSSGHIATTLTVHVGHDLTGTTRMLTALFYKSD